MPTCHGTHQVTRTIDDRLVTITEHRPLHQIGAHSHSFACMHYVLRGIYVEIAQGQAVIAFPGSILFKGADVEHCNTIGPGGSTTLRVEVEQGHQTGLAAGETTRPSLLTHLVNSGAALMRTGLRCAESIRSGRAQESARDVRALLQASGNRTGVPHPAGEGLEAHAAQIVLDARPPCVTVQHVAERLGVHRSTVARRFRTLFGCTLQQYILRQHLVSAARLLAGTERELIDIAFDCGFSDQPHLTRTFRSMLGSTPGHWRELVRNLSR